MEMAVAAAVAVVAHPVHGCGHRSRAPVRLALVLARLSRDSVRPPRAALHFPSEQHHLVLAFAAPGLARGSGPRDIQDASPLARSKDE